MERKKTNMPTNYRGSIENIRKMYNSHNGDNTIDWIHAFQKDSIQNAIGARLSKNIRKWKFEMYFFIYNNLNILVLEDKGTTGLTGENISMSEIDSLNKRDNYSFPQYERLSRFSSSNNSGGMEFGGGLYGIGKSVYAMASDNYMYYFDSLSKDGYRANLNNTGELYDLAYEEEEAKNFIKSNLGLDELTEYGTRISIINPNSKLVEKILDGTMKKYIEDTWNRAIIKFDCSSNIKINGEIIGYPRYYDKSNIIKSHNQIKPFPVKENYIVKKIGLTIVKKCSVNEAGFYFYRKGMKIGEINIQSNIANLKHDYIGYIEVDKEWEDELAVIENITHYDVESNKKMTAAYSILRNAVNEYFDDRMVEWGYKNNEVHINEKINKELELIKYELEGLVNDLGVDNLGQGELKNKIGFRISRVDFPEVGTRSIYAENLTIKVKYSAYSRFKTKVKTVINAEIVDNYGNRSDKIQQSFVLDQENIIGEIKVKINKHNSTSYSKNAILISFSPEKGEKITKRIEFFYKIETPVITIKDFSVLLDNITFPRKKTKKVLIGDSVKKIKYKIINRTAEFINVELRVGVHNMESNGDLIETVDVKTVRLDSFEEKIVDVEDIYFDKETYDSHLSKGVLELRARLVSLENAGLIERGDRLANHKTKIYYNRNEKKGIEDIFDAETVDEPDNYLRAWNEGTSRDRIIVFNIGNPAYLFARRKDTTKVYFMELMVSQLVNIYIKEGNVSILGLSMHEFSKLDPYLKHKKIDNSIERIVNKVYRGYK